MSLYGIFGEHTMARNKAKRSAAARRAAITRRRNRIPVLNRSPI